MQVSRFYKELFEYNLGFDVIGLESQIPKCVKIVEEKTIQTFSTIIAPSYKIYLDLEDEKNIIRKDWNTLGVEYRLDDPVLQKFKLPIMSVDQIDYNNNGGTVDPYDPNSSQYYSSVIASRQNLSIENVLMGAEYTYNRTLTDFSMPWKRYYEYRGNNILYLRNYAFGGRVEITVRTRWPNLQSIPEEFRNDLMQLAKYDVEVNCWTGLRYLESIVTPAGNLDLKFDWSNAEQEREDYIKELRTRAFPDRINTRYFFIA